MELRNAVHVDVFLLVPVSPHPAMGLTAATLAQTLAPTHTHAQGTQVQGCFFRDSGGKRWERCKPTLLMTFEVPPRRNGSPAPTLKTSQDPCPQCGLQQHTQCLTARIVGTHSFAQHEWTSVAERDQRVPGAGTLRLSCAHGQAACPCPSGQPASIVLLSMGDNALGRVGDEGEMTLPASEPGQA